MAAFAEYEGAVSIISGLMALPGSKRALTAVSGALLEAGAIPGDKIRAIVREAETGKATARAQESSGERPDDGSRTES
jgi:hypothetical protein